MGLELGRWLGRSIDQAALLDRRRTLIVPFPMPWIRRLHRGIDHARVIGLGVSHQLRCPLVPLLSQSNGTPQTALAASARRRCGGRTLRVRRRFSRVRLSGLQVIIVDDVRTTGQSLREAVRRLRPLGPERVIAAVVAVTEGLDRRPVCRDTRSSTETEQFAQTARSRVDSASEMGTLPGSVRVVPGTGELSLGPADPCRVGSVSGSYFFEK